MAVSSFKLHTSVTNLLSNPSALRPQLSYTIENINHNNHEMLYTHTDLDGLIHKQAHTKTEPHAQTNAHTHKHKYSLFFTQIYLSLRLNSL